MVAYLDQSRRIIVTILENADFDDAFPHVFGVPNEEDGEPAIRNECALILRKAQLHIHAAMVANQNNNVHSLTVQMKVVLECVSHILLKSNAVVKGGEDQLAHMTNLLESDFADAMLRLSRGKVGPLEVNDDLRALRRRIADQNVKPPKRVRITDKAVNLVGGRWMYDYLSDNFAGEADDPLNKSTISGGVLSSNTPQDQMAIAFFLDQLALQTLSMLQGYAAILYIINGDSRNFDEMSKLRNRQASIAQRFRRDITDLIQRS